MRGKLINHHGIFAHSQGHTKRSTFTLHLDNGFKLRVLWIDCILIDKVYGNMWLTSYFAKSVAVLSFKIIIYRFDTVSIRIIDVIPGCTLMLQPIVWPMSVIIFRICPPTVVFWISCKLPLLHITIFTTLARCHIRHIFGYKKWYEHNLTV